jgi:hypothetical protein
MCMKPYKPAAIDIAWARQMVAITAQNAVWVWKDTTLMYRFDHDKKTLTLLNPSLLEEKELRIAHEMTVEVFKVIDYTVKLLDKQD